MVALATSHFITKSYHHGALESRPRTFLIPNLRPLSAAYHGLRQQQPLDSLQMRAATRSTPRQCERSVNGGAISCSTGMNLVYVGTETGPHSKTGGLGDVLGGLPPAMAARGHRVMVVTPRYDQYKDAWDTGVVIEVKVGDQIESVRFFHSYKRGVDRIFIDHPWFLAKVWGKTGGKLYGPVTGTDYDDNQMRFSLLCLAALEAPRVLNLNNSEYFSGPYGEDVVFIANDWHTGPLSCYLKSMYQSVGIYKNAKVAFCIHNIAYQGRFPLEDFSLLNLPDKFKTSFDFLDGYLKPVKGRKINWMRAGILEADAVMTVSPYYAKELVSGEDKGVELDQDITKTGIKGIVNGMDINVWNPLIDKYITANYDATTVTEATTTVTEAKRVNKQALQAEVGLPVDPDIPVIVFVGRLEEQKGSDILAAAIPDFIDENVQIIILGTGKKIFEKQVEEIEEQYPDKARGIAKFNVPLAHMLMAGGDLIIVPSRFEPCGLIQLEGMQYGVPAICSTTGGLADTIKDGFTGFHMGAFSVNCEAIDPVDVAATVKTVKRALKAYGTPAFSEMVQNCMAQDLSWKEPAKKWEELLLDLGVEGSAAGIDGEEIAPMALENVAAP
nr:granule-bound starch synthase [Fritillaria thunbergii]